MIRIGINGACGRMGLRLVVLTSQQSDMRLSLAIEKPKHPLLGKDIGLVAGLSQPLGVTITDQVTSKNTDIILDFSTPEGTLSCVSVCEKFRIPLLIGTTGLSKKEMGKIKKASERIPCLVSPNFSRGANLLFEITPLITRRLEDKELRAEIIEIHHRFKKDAPSGTANRLAQELKVVFPNKEVPIHSLRMGDVVGEHRVVWGLPGERIELVHRVDNRDAFVYGALEAARWLVRAKPGFYTLKKEV